MSGDVRRSPRARKSWTGGMSAPNLTGSTSTAAAHNNTINTLPLREMKQPNQKAPMAKRAKSMGGAELLRNQLDIAPPSRRNVPGPRKSSIRSAPPQEFASPSTVLPSPTVAKLRGKQNAIIFGSSASGNDLSSRLAPTTTPKTAASSLPSQQHQLSRSNSDPENLRQAAPAGAAGIKPAGFQTQVIPSVNELGADADAAAPAAKKRRVTFGNRIATTKFGPEEPTLHIRPISDESMPDMTNSSASGMGIDTDDSDTDEDELDMDITAGSSRMGGNVSAGSGGYSFASSASAVEASADASSMDMDQSSMDISSGGADEDGALSVSRPSSVSAGAEEVSESLESEEDETGDGPPGDDQTQTMEFTHAMGSGPVGAASMPHDGDEDEDETTSDMDESEAVGEQSGMEFTQALGGIRHARSSIAGRRSLTARRSLAGGADEDRSMAMDITEAFGGIRTAPIREEDEEDSSSEDDDDSQDEDDVTEQLTGQRPRQSDVSAMQMTVALGRIASPSKTMPRSPARNAPHSPSKSAAAQAVSSPRTGHEHCHKPLADSPNLRRTPSPSKRSPQRQTPTSARKAAPVSPSPQPRAAQAFRSPSPSKMTPQPGTPSRFRLSLRGGVPSPGMVHSPARRITITPKSPRRSQAPIQVPSQAPMTEAAAPVEPGPAPPIVAAPLSPSRIDRARAERKSLGGTMPATHRLSTIFKPDPSGGLRARSSMAPAVVVEESEAPSSSSGTFQSAPESAAAVASNVATIDEEEEEEEEEQVGEDDDDDGEKHLSLAQFFAHVGLEWHDQMVPSRQSLEVPPGVRQIEPRAVEIMRHAKAGAGSVPMLERLIAACRELQNSVLDGHERHKLFDQQFSDRPPLVITEMMALDEKDRDEMEQQLGLQKSAARASVLQHYYGWRADIQFDETAIEELERNKARLESVAAFVDEQGERLNKEVLPELRKRHAELAEELRRENKRRQEIAAADPEELKGVHQAIDEQGQMLQEIHAKKSSTKEKLSGLEARLAEIEARRSAAQRTIDALRVNFEQIKGYTPGEASRLLRETRNLEALHLWTLRGTSGPCIELVHARSIETVIHLDQDGRVAKVDLQLARPLNGAVLAEWALDVIRGEMDRAEDLTVMRIVRRVSTAWARLREVSCLYDSLAAHFPCHLSLADDEGSTCVVLRIDVIMASHKSRAEVALPITKRAILEDDVRNQFQEPAVTVIYGPASPPKLQDALLRNLDLGAADLGLVAACRALQISHRG